MKKHLVNSHDKFFKSVMSNITFAKDFIIEFFPKDLVSSLDLESLHLSKTDFISEGLKESFSDVVYTCNLKSEEKVYISILLEHKSYFDKGTSVQLLNYLANSYRYQYKNKKTLFPVIPMVVYHGKERWKFIPLESLFEDLPKYILKYIPNFYFENLDLNTTSEKRIKEMGNMLLSSVLLTQKYIFSPYKLINKISSILEVFEMEEERNLLRTVLVYILNNIEKIEIEEILVSLPNKIKSEVMTIAQKLIKEGIKEGIQEGMQKGMQQGMKKGEYIAKVETIIKGFNAGASIELLSIQTGMLKEDVKKIIKENNN